MMSNMLKVQSIDRLFKKIQINVDLGKLNIIVNDRSDVYDGIIFAIMDNKESLVF